MYLISMRSTTVYSTICVKGILAPEIKLNRRQIGHVLDLPFPMSTAIAEPPRKPQPKSKTKEKRQGQTKASGTERFKIIVRRLPPNLPEQIFWQSVQPWVTDDTVLWKEFYPGKSRGKR